jgi:hypothetical protein
MPKEITFHKLDTRATIVNYRLSEIYMLLDDARQMPELADEVSVAQNAYFRLREEMIPILNALLERQEKALESAEQAR